MPCVSLYTHNGLMDDGHNIFGLGELKTDFCLCRNNAADQLCGNRRADQRLCFRDIVDFLYLLNPKFKASKRLRWLHSLVFNGPVWKSQTHFLATWLI